MTHARQPLTFRVRDANVGSETLYAEMAAVSGRKRSLLYDHLQALPGLVPDVHLAFDGVDFAARDLDLHAPLSN